MEMMEVVEVVFGDGGDEAVLLSNMLSEISDIKIQQFDLIDRNL